MSQVTSRVAIVVARYNEVVTAQLLSGAQEELVARGYAAEQTDVYWVPGAWEIPLATSELLKTKKHHAVICLGAVIRGETTHDQHINRMISMTLGKLSMDHGVPVAFGVLTCNTLEQALQRAGGNLGNKGAEAVSAALEMVHLLQGIQSCS